MNWQKEAESDLKDYKRRKAAIENLSERISALEDKFTSIHSVSTDRERVQGSGGHAENAVINNIAERERLNATRSAVGKLVALTEKGLSALDNRQRLVLEQFYINREYGHVENICEALHVEKSQAYRLKDEALQQFTMCMFGMGEY